MNLVLHSVAATLDNRFMLLADYDAVVETAVLRFCYIE